MRNLIFQSLYYVGSLLIEKKSCKYFKAFFGTSPIKHVTRLTFDSKPKLKIVSRQFCSIPNTCFNINQVLYFELGV